MKAKRITRNEAKDKLQQHMFEGMISSGEELGLNEAWALHGMMLAYIAGYVSDERKQEMLREARKESPIIYKAVKEFFDRAEKGEIYENEENRTPRPKHSKSPRNDSGDDTTDNASFQREGTETNCGQASKKGR